MNKLEQAIEKETPIKKAHIEWLESIRCVKKIVSFDK